MIGPARVGRPFARVGERLRVPLYRNGYALVLSSFLGSTLGLAYWLVAARSYSAEAVGIGAALIATMTLIGDLAQLNLKSALNRFLPTSGGAANRLVVSAYAISAILAVLGSLVFLFGLELWAPDLGVLVDRPDLALLFVAGAIAWTVFVLQDSVLVGIRKATWVPTENLVYSVAKIVALVAFAAAFPTLGVFLSWTLALPLVIVPLNLLIFRRLVPRHVRDTAGAAEPIVRRHVVRYVGGDYLAYLTWSATMGLMPLIVLQALGAEANAYFFVAWAMAYALYVISSGMGQAMIAEAALDGARLNEYARQAAAESARFVLPLVAILVLGAPLILGVMGPAYAQEGTTVLRLLALSAIPYILVSAAVNVARVQRRMTRVVVIYVSLCAGVIGLTWLLLEPMGITGVGVAWLTSQTAVAAVIAAPWIARWLAGRAPSRLLRPALAVRDRLGAMVGRRAAVRRLRAAASALPVEAVGGVRSAEPLGGGAGEVAVGRITTDDGARIVKVALSPEGDAALARNRDRLVELLADARLGVSLDLIPRPLATGELDGRRVEVEQARPGISLAHLLGRSDDPAPLAAAVAAISAIHHATATRAPITHDDLAAWIDRPCALLRERLDGARWLADLAPEVDRLAGELRGALASRTVTTTLIHGDYTPHNVLINPATGIVTGIVDWDQAAVGLPEIDLVHLAVAARAQRTRREFGEVIARLIAGDQPLIRELGAAAPDDRRYAVGTRALVLIAWLAHVRANLGKAAGYGGDSVWGRRNVRPVLLALGDAGTRRRTGSES